MNQFMTILTILLNIDAFIVLLILLATLPLLALLFVDTFKKKEDAHHDQPTANH